VLVFVVLCAGARTPLAAPVTVRPGVFAGGCTLGFLFDGGNGERYIGSAGHCFLDDGTERTWSEGGPSVTVGGHVIGAVAYAIWNQSILNPLPGDPSSSLPVGFDFALIRLSASTQANPQMCHFGGPTGINSSTDHTPRAVHYVGAGEFVGTIQETSTPVFPARSASATGFADPTTVALNGPVGPGDSGMPVIDREGRAVGLLSHLGSPMGSSFAPVSRLQPHVARASAALGVSLSLRTAPLIEDATPFGHDAC
jgi:hypothetical protein